MPQDDVAPAVGQAETLAPGVRRILAPNPSPMTYYGTNTYILGTGTVAVIDPGPGSDVHLDAILAALSPGERISHILVTHAHIDHSPLSRALARETGAPVLAFGPPEAGRSAAMQALARTGALSGGEGVDHEFRPDETLADGAEVIGGNWRVKALWTPGHFCNHLSFQMGDVIFCGDLVMGWASSLVSPPDGDLTDFLASCHRLRDCGARVLHPGHGAPILDPAARIDWLIAHRAARETAILTQLKSGPANAASLAQAIYTETSASLMPAAARNVLAHLIDLNGRKICAPHGPLTAYARFRLVSEPSSTLGTPS